MSESTSKIQYFYFFDNNIFRALCTSPNGAAINAFNESLSRYVIRKSLGLATAFKLTPFTLLEAIGITPPTIEKFLIPQSLVAKKSETEIAGYIIDTAEKLYRQSPELKLENILRRTEIQRQHTTREAKDLFDICITHVISSEGFENYVYRCLSFDYLYKFQFPLSIRPLMLGFLITTLFVFNDLANSLSRFRLAKALWDQTYNFLIKRFPARKEYLDQTNYGMKLKTHRDYVDCELIHYLVYGYDYGDTTVPVAGFTTDEGGVIVSRITTYKAMIGAAVTQLEETIQSEYKERLMKRPAGLLAICNKDGSFASVIQTKDIPSFIDY